jgi:DNA-binding NarL/FixJ family response regulator
VEVKVGIALDRQIIREGIRSLVNSIDNATCVDSYIDSTQLFNKLNSTTIDSLIIDYSAENFCLNDIQKIKSFYPHIKIIALTELIDKSKIEKALQLGVNAYILNCCDAEEIQGAIFDTLNGERFFCGKVLSYLNDDKELNNCSAISLSNRELEVIHLIAEGKTNKIIADELFLSTHTVMTHRKNIMAKLGVKNTAGIVIFAVKENIISPNKFLFAGETN